MIGRRRPAPTRSPYLRIAPDHVLDVYLADGRPDRRAPRRRVGPPNVVQNRVERDRRSPRQSQRRAPGNPLRRRHQRAPGGCSGSGEISASSRLAVGARLQLARMAQRGGVPARATSRPAWWRRPAPWAPSSAGSSRDSTAGRGWSPVRRWAHRRAVRSECRPDESRGGQARDGAARDRIRPLVRVRALRAAGASD